MAIENSGSHHGRQLQQGDHGNPSAPSDDQPGWWVQLKQNHRAAGQGGASHYRAQQQQQRVGSDLAREQQMNQQFQ